MLIPLGLRIPLPRFPWITMLLATVSVVFFALETPLKEWKGYVKASAEKQELDRAVDELFFDYCEKNSLPKDGCAAIMGRTIEESETPTARGLASKEQNKSEKWKRSSGALFGLKVHFGYFKSQFNLKPIPQFIRESKSFQKFKEKKKAFVEGAHEKIVEGQLLSSSSLKPLPVLLAQFRHDGLLHILGNLVFLIAFGIYVEQRIPRLAYLALVLLGGTAGITLHASTLESYQVLIGASANVAAVMGMFYALFYHQKMGLYAWFPFLSKTVYLPISRFFPVLYIGMDLAGLVLQELNLTRVAHLAHVGGLSFGLLAGYLIQHFQKIEAPFIYKGALEKFKKMQTENTLEKGIELAEDLLHYNRWNGVIRSAACEKILSLIETGVHIRKDSKALPFINKHLGATVQELLKKGKIEKAYSLSQRIPFSVNHAAIFKKLSQKQMLILGE